MPFSSLHIPTAQLNLAAVLKCGQSFRWSILPLPTTDTGPTHEYRLCLKDRVVCLRQSPDTLFYRAAFPDPPPPASQHALRDAETLAWLKDYFQLDIDLVQLYDKWAERDKVFARFRDRFTGIRILRQDPWENVVSFICSSNNNISRITKMVQGLCNHYSLPLLSLSDPCNPDQLFPYHPFPPPSRLSQPDVSATLRTLGFGYRAEFIQKTAKYLVDSHGSDTLLDDPSEASEKWLKGLRDASTSEAREELLKLTGVGRKVADCILLMSLDKKEVVPVDTHVYQIAVKYYGMKGSTSGKTNMTPKLYDEVNAKLFSVWGEYAGWAHSVMFTADLKSFADYNATPSSSPQKTSTPKRKREEQLKGEEEADCLPTPPITPGPTTLSKAAMEAAAAVLKGERSDLYSETTTMSVADRVKRQRNVK
ncbi:N-glycosylase/DNA lyase [Leucoagaricus sp. SymC.cos]|nr:N-glycosylase/DNA lyase [Leucoagaricus sp. SymC.cos]